MDTTKLNGSRLTVADAAYCAAAWASGERQKDLAALFGFKQSSPICHAICEFLDAYADPTAIPCRRHHMWAQHPTGNKLVDNMVYGTERKALVPAALARFQQARR